MKLLSGGPHWTDEAICTQIDAELFFPEDQPGVSPRVAKRFCQGCPVQAECLEFAVTESLPFGVWGGYSSSERRPFKTLADAQAVIDRLRAEQPQPATLQDAIRPTPERQGLVLVVDIAPTAECASVDEDASMPVWQRVRTTLKRHGLKSSVVRQWAIDEGFDIKPGGPLSVDIVDVYLMAHAGKAAA